MKKYLIIAAISFLGFNSNSQINKTDQFIGGSISLGNNFKDKQWSYSINPNYGYFIRENLAVGVGLNLYGAKFSNSYSFYDYGGDVFIKKYYKIDNNNSFFFSLNYAIGYSHLEKRNSTYDNINNKVYYIYSNQNELKTSIIPSFTFFPTKKLALSLNIGSLMYQYTIDTKTSEINLNLNSIGFGLNYFFRRS
jgi:hypothetical protein